MQYDEYFDYDQNNPYLSTYNLKWSNHPDSHWSNQQKNDSALEDMISKFMSKVDERIDFQDNTLKKLEAKIDQVAQHIQMAFQSLDVQINQLAIEIHWQEQEALPSSMEPYSMKQCNEIALEIEKLVEHPMWVDQVEMEVSKSVSLVVEASTFPKPLELCLLYDTTVKEDSHQGTYVFVDIGEGKPRPSPPFEQPPCLGRKKIPSHFRYAKLGELSSLPVS
ncbi:hypothetical protein ACOSP7_022424 [Xanthoceras sorbifolium]